MKEATAYDFIINRRSGTAMRDGEARVEENLREVFAGAAGDMRFVKGCEIAAAVQEWLADPRRRENCLLIGGGDGTLLTAVEQVFDKGVTLGVLPLGTQNFVARQLGFSPDYKKAATQYQNSSSVSLDVGKVNGHHFLYGFLWDKGSVNLFAAREAVRNGDVVTAFKKASLFARNALGGRLQTMRVREAGVAVSDVQGRIFAVTNNAFAPRSNHDVNLWMPDPDYLLRIFGNMFAKKAEGDGKLAFYAHEGGARRLARMAPKLWDGTWVRDTDLTVRQAESFTIEPAPGQNKPERLLIVLDGEAQETSYPLKIDIHPRALKIKQYAAPFLAG